MKTHTSSKQTMKIFGVEVELVKKKRAPWSIIVRCPKCGRKGRLVSWHNHKWKPYFRIVHANEVHYIPQSHEGYDLIERIYREVRYNRRLK